MKNINFYRRLPITMDENDIENEVIELFSNEQHYTNGVLLECLLEISERQVLNYCLLNASIRKMLNREILARWDEDSVDNTETCISIIIQLGLQTAYEYMLSKAENIMNINVKNEILETYEEMGSSVEYMGITL